MDPLRESENNANPSKICVNGFSCVQKAGSSHKSHLGLWNIHALELEVRHILLTNTDVSQLAPVSL